MECEDCGRKMYRGLCVNCHEEAYIFETQLDSLPEKLSDDFISKVGKQLRDRKERTGMNLPKRDFSKEVG